jgi:methionyl-tRNA synthetase
MVFKNCEKAIPSEIGPYTAEDEALLAKARSLKGEAGKHVASQAIHKYVETMVEMIWESNKYIDEMAPWVLRKTDPERMATVLYVLMEVLRYSAILYQPLIPQSANKILDQLCVPNDERSFEHLNDSFALKPGTSISKPEGVFPRLEMPEESVVV